MHTHIFSYVCEPFNGKQNLSMQIDFEKKDFLESLILNIGMVLALLFVYLCLIMFVCLVPLTMVC